MIKICIADNQPVVLQGVKSFFKENLQFDVAYHAQNLTELLDLLQSKKINIVVIDIELEGLSSIRDIKALIEDFPDTKIIVFTAVSEKMYFG